MALNTGLTGSVLYFILIASISMESVASGGSKDGGLLLPPIWWIKCEGERLLLNHRRCWDSWPPEEKNSIQGQK